MNYDYLIWGHWQASSIALFFLLIMVYYAVRKYEFGQENLSDARLKWFTFLCIVFALYYVFIYAPRPKLIQNMFLTVVNSNAHVSYNFNSGPLLSIVVFIVLAMLFYYGYKFVSKKVFKVGTVAK